MNEALTAVEFFFMLTAGAYFLTHIKIGRAPRGSADTQMEKERLNALRRVSLTEPLTEAARPKQLGEIVGQETGLRALKAALCGPNPQHVLIYGPAGVGKTAAARLALDCAKKSAGTPFRHNAKFIEADATIMRYDERSIADPLIGSVHDPIYQGAGAYGENGIPKPCAGAVTKAHGGILFIDEIGCLAPCQMNKLLKVLEDRRVFFESSYYSENDKNIPQYIHDIFRNGMPADFRLIGATTQPPESIPEAIRSRCTEVYFDPLSRESLEIIICNAAARLNIGIEDGAVTLIARRAKNGRDAVKILQTAKNIAALDGRCAVTADDAAWTLHACRYTGKIVDVSIIKPGAQ